MERPKLLPVHGVPMLDFIARDWSLVESFKARPGDVLIATYPKAGTTWTQEIVDLIQSGVDVEHCKRGPVYERIVFMEWTGINFVMHRKGVEVLNDMPSPRTIKTHLPYQLMPSSFWDNDCKVIYIARNAKDNAVSAFHFNRMNKLHPEPGTWEEYLHRFMTGNVCWGSWHDHVTDWWNMRERHRILYLFFEDMKEDPMREVSRIARFLERPLSEQQLREVVKLTSFPVMRDNPMTNYSTLPTDFLNHSVSPFMRKGDVGDWRNHFSAAQLEAFEQDYKKKMATTDLRLRDSLP
ncbi:sulfotransferase 1 family member D1-like isoform X1 [Lethenteron reissneri]|uniref:sulfotransferase 1 family member D1-like isoform X1 n=1 Tax=Lethenteron reissneri TaxID=7753 RepID=UPI002AB7DAEF|nr:sulfotransferase 1 family member D1-like isoform X1 [Lethenteron reissneri]XP_061435689.1 sulfotransferase 1 family member D1-like isoform X1 [Lethenteron reissneri]